ncbi:MAG TPA: hypothetical protein ENJ28_07455 [Gammaproteobacteria bacterium]|nr:hypothetical protein [Gammaproteobacteria bacterium]
MKTLVFIFLVLTGISYQIHADNYKSSKDNIEKYDQSINEMSRSANLAAKNAGVSEVGSISCSPGLIRCTCEGVFNCAWLSMACSDAGGIQGFEGECFFPKSVPGASAAINKFVSRTRKPK